MGIIGQVLLGVAIVVAGVLILIKNYQVANSIPLAFFEQKMGPGSSYLIWKVFSVLLVLAGLTTMFGFHDEILSWALSPLTNILSPSE